MIILLSMGYFTKNIVEGQKSIMNIACMIGGEKPVIIQAIKSEDLIVGLVTAPLLCSLLQHCYCSLHRSKIPALHHAYLYSIHRWY